MVYDCFLACRLLEGIERVVHTESGCLLVRSVFFVIKKTELLTKLTKLTRAILCQFRKLSAKRVESKFISDCRAAALVHKF